MIAWRPLTALAILVLGLFLYLPTLDLMLFWDDIPHMQWLASQSNGSYWLTSQGFPFYRPTAFTTWEVMHTVWGYHNPQALHALSMLLHILNAWLVATIIGKITEQPRSGLWAGLIFLAFPFSYQAVIPTPAHFHLWLVSSMLAAGWCMLRWHDTKRQYYLGLAWGLAFGSIFSHENGVLAPALLGGILLAYRIPWRQLLLPLIPVAAFSILYGLMWLLVPKANETSNLQLDALEAKIGLTLQAIGYPIAAILRRVVDPADGTTLAWISGGIIVVTIIVWAMIRRRYLALMALAWIPLVMAPAWLLLDINYLLGSPRLHYLSAVGVAWSLGFFFDHLWTQRSLLVGTVGVVGYLVIAIPFIRDRVAQHQVIDSIYQDVGSIADQLPPDSKLLLVNGPAYLAPEAPTFLIGAEGSTYLPDFVRLQDWLTLNRYGTNIQAANRRAEDIIPAVGQRFAVEHPPLDRTTIRQYDAVATVMKFDDELHTYLTGRQTSLDINSPLADFGNGILLLEANFDAANLQLELVWQRQQQPQPSNAIFVHLQCANKVSQADGPPLGLLYPLSLWEDGETWRDYRYFETTPDDKPCQSVFVGMWNTESGTRLPINATEQDGIIIRPQ